ncbi:hypothetical protein ABIE49_007906 [Bradyrhizobium sp. OAE829]
MRRRYLRRNKTMTVVPALSTDAQLRIGGLIRRGDHFAKGANASVSTDGPRRMGPGVRRDDSKP